MYLKWRGAECRLEMGGGDTRDEPRKIATHSATALLSFVIGAIAVIVPALGEYHAIASRATAAEKRAVAVEGKVASAEGVYLCR